MSVGRRKHPPRVGWPAGLLGMLALVGVVERYVARHDTKFTTVGASAWRRAGAAVPGKVAGGGVVGFGDSLVKHGVLPAVLERRLGLRAYNLAVPKGQAAGHDFLLRRMLRAGARPAALLVDGEMLQEDPLENARTWPELATLGECAELAWAARDGRFLAVTTLARALPSFKARAEVRRSVLAALDGKVPDETQALAIIWRNWNKNGGAYVLPPRPEPPGQDPRPAELERTNYRPAAWAPHPLNAAYVERLLDRAASRGIPVFWLLPPYHPEVQARRERYGWDGAYMAFVRALQQRHPNLTVIDGRHAGYAPEALADMTHLNRIGAAAFSDAVGLVLRDRLARPGSPWVELPRYRDGAAAAVEAVVVVEDLSQSGQALARLAEGRRLGRRDGPDGGRRRR